MKVPCIAVVDLGASGGRITLAARRDNGLEFLPIHEFSHPVHIWVQSGPAGDITRRAWNPGVIYHNILTGLAAAPDWAEIQSIGVDGWGSDGVWLGKDGDMLGVPVQGRDSRWLTARQEIEDIVSDRERFDMSGVRNEPFCAINLVYWHSRHTPWLVDNADVFMPLPALFTYWLCGERAADVTWIGTSQLMSINGGYHPEVFSRLGMPLDKMPRLTRPGTILGDMHRALSENLGSGRIRVISPAHHDTACAFAAAGGTDGTFIISAGTWWLSGVPAPEAIVGRDAYDRVLTNVPGYDGWILHHVGFGSWLAQELRRRWSAEDGRQMTWEEYNALALGPGSAPKAIDTNDPRLLAPADMAAALRACSGDGGSGRADLVRLVRASLAAKTRENIDAVEKVSGRRMREVLVIGGGAHDDAMNRFLADSLGLRVRTGLTNATTVGNAMIQACALGWFGSMAEARAAVRREKEKIFEPD